ncbi:MAG: 4Fe-4S binding protein [Deltaproteobacteria bacterium]|nr:4Fe-4S binding protein [Deltaproteobacteria bacterium]
MNSASASQQSARHTKWIAAPAAAVFTLFLLIPVQMKVHPAMLLAERWMPGLGWLQIALLSAYAGWLASRLLDPGQVARTRRIVWTIFSTWFFTQLILGVLGVPHMLMTGTLHLPIPAVVIAGPVYHGHFFMPILFLITVVLVGPTWCSYLCYLGAWDANFAATKPRPTKEIADHSPWRLANLVLIVLVAWVLRVAGVGWIWATILGLVFGLAGIVVMIVLSRRTGIMTHCVWFCPLGLAASVLGKLSPHRIRIADSCTECMVCSTSCRYDALRPEHIRARKPGLSCTLCGDCLAACPHNSIEYRFAGIRASWSRPLFIVMIAGIQAVFLGLARI